MGKATLALDDGTIFEGEGFGATRAVGGEVVFNTGMVGYVESLTDPRFSADRTADVDQQLDGFAKSMLVSDPPDHTRLRALVQKAFTPRMVEQLRNASADQPTLDPTLPLRLELEKQHVETLFATLRAGRETADAPFGLVELELRALSHWFI